MRRRRLTKEQAKWLGSEAGYQKLIASLPEMRNKVAEAEKARLEAERGELVLNAFPWGNVESVVDSNRQQIRAAVRREHAARAHRAGRQLRHHVPPSESEQTGAGDRESRSAQTRDGERGVPDDFVEGVFHACGLVTRFARVSVSLR